MKLTCQIETNEDSTWCEASVSLYRIFARRFNRKDIQWAKSQPFANKSGIYFLFGPQSEVPRRLYIGQAEKRQDESLGIVNRMNETPAHEKILDWTEGVMFVYTDDFLDDNPLKLRYLEHKFWNDANFILSSSNSQSKYQLVNRCPRDGNIQEPVRDILNIFVLYCKTILNFMGLPVYKIDSGIFNERINNSTFDASSEQVNISSSLPNNSTPPNNTASNEVHNSPISVSSQNNFVNQPNITTSETSKNQNNRIFYFKDTKDRFNATGKLEADNTSFTVLKGSRVILNPPGDKVKSDNYRF